MQGELAPVPRSSITAPRANGPGVDEYPFLETPEPHVARGKELLLRHPELRALSGPAPVSVVVIVALVAAQIAIAFALRGARWWVVLLVAYTVGSFLTYGLWAMIHEAGHHVIVKGRAGNRAFGILANLPMVVPSGISFMRYHNVHHLGRGVVGQDTDLAEEWEARLVGRHPVAKILWQTLFTITQSVRTIRLSKNGTLRFLDGWTLANIVLGFSFDAWLFAHAGPAALGYLLASLVFSVGPHPLGARWIQEHFIFAEGQETYSYYGPLNLVAFNVGYHVEHHDLPGVPWTRLPQLRAGAPEMYDHLFSHRSWTRVWLRFLFDRNLTLYSRYTRPAMRGAVGAPRAVEGLQAVLARTSLDSAAP